MVSHRLDAASSVMALPGSVNLLVALFSIYRQRVLQLPFLVRDGSFIHV